MSKTADNVVSIGGNAEADLKRRIDRRVEIAERAAELKEELDECKKEDKADGYNEKAIADAVKLRRADPEKVLATLYFEEEKKVYRKAAGVPVEIGEAEKQVRAHVEDVPEPKAKSRRSRSDVN